MKKFLLFAAGIAVSLSSFATDVDLAGDYILIGKSLSSGYLDDKGKATKDVQYACPVKITATDNGYALTGILGSDSIITATFENGQLTLPKAPVVGHNTSGDIFLYAYTTVYSRTRTIVFDLTDEGNLELVKPIVGLIKMLSSGTTSYKPAIYSDGKLMKANATNTVTIASKMSDNTGETSVKPVRITFDGDSGVVYGLTTSKTCTYQKFAIAANDSVTFCQDQASAYSTDTYYSLVMTAVAYGSSWKYIADPEGKMGLAPVKGKLDRKAGTPTIDPWTVYAQKVDGTGYTYNVNYPAIRSVIQFDPQIATSVKDAEIADDENVAPVYYNLQGIRVANPENGIFIEVRGKKATKVIK